MARWSAPMGRGPIKVTLTVQKRLVQSDIHSCPRVILLKPLCRWSLHYKKILGLPITKWLPPRPRRRPCRRLGASGTQERRRVPRLLLKGVQLNDWHVFYQRSSRGTIFELFIYYGTVGRCAWHCNEKVHSFINQSLENTLDGSLIK